MARKKKEQVESKDVVVTPTENLEIKPKKPEKPNLSNYKRKLRKLD